MRDKILIVGPLPPAIGGIASIVSSLKNELIMHENIIFLDSRKPANYFQKLLLPFVLLIKITKYSLLNKNLKVLVFSSANYSFWEKSLWGQFVKINNSELFVVMVDGNFPSFFEALSPRKKEIARFVMANATIVCQSSSWGNYFHEIFPKSNIGMITGGVNTDYFRPNNVCDNKKDMVTILYVGWVIKAKGIYEIITAGKILKNQGLKFNIELVGPIYEDTKILNKFITEYDLQENITVGGHIDSRETLRDKYCSSEIFVFPSHYEGFPVALLEAISSGLPCIGTNVGGIPDILDNGGCGIVIEKESPERLAEALSKLIKDRSLREELGKKARERAVENYTLGKCINSYKQVLSIQN